MVGHSTQMAPEQGVFVNDMAVRDVERDPRHVARYLGLSDDEQLQALQLQALFDLTEEPLSKMFEAFESLKTRSGKWDMIKVMKKIKKSTTKKNSSDESSDEYLIPEEYIMSSDSLPADSTETFMAETQSQLVYHALRMVNAIFKLVESHRDKDKTFPNIFQGTPDEYWEPIWREKLFYTKEWRGEDIYRALVMFTLYRSQRTRPFRDRNIPHITFPDPLPQNGKSISYAQSRQPSPT